MMTDKLNQAAASVSEWNAKICRLREDISIAEAALADSTRLRQQHVLDAALGDDCAKSRLAEVLNADRDADRHFSDLQLALPAAEAKLREAEAAHRTAEAEWRKAEVNRLARERCEAAAAIDSAFAEFSKAYATFVSLGHELLDLASQAPGANAYSSPKRFRGRRDLRLPCRPNRSWRSGSDSISCRYLPANRWLLPRQPIGDCRRSKW